MRYLTLSEVLELHRQVIGQSGGALGVLNLSALESVLAQPRMTFGGKDLYPSIVWRKRQRLATRLSRTIHSWNGNKRTGHAAMEVFLFLNDFEIQSSVDEQETIILQVASGEMDREAFTGWLRDHVTARS